MRKKAERDSLRRIAEIWRLKRDSAEMLAERAQTEVLRKSEARKLRDAEVVKAQADWDSAVSQTVWRLETVPSLGMALREQDALSALSREAAEHAIKSRDRAAKGLHLATHHSDVAFANAQIAARRHLAAIEETTIFEAADRYLQYRDIP